MALDKATVTHIARLARLRVPDDELEAVAGELSNILAWIEQLGEVDTTDVEPMTGVVEARLPRRRDEVSDGGCQADVLANAPESRDGFFVVPKVVE